jgi:DNA-binding NarL/FixJ family response regulator
VSATAAAGRSISVLIVEDHLAVRKGLELLLCGHGHQIVGATDDPERAMDIIELRRPDVALVDIDLGATSGTTLAQRVLRLRNGIGVLLYSGRQEPELLADALACGAHGFALKAGPPGELLDAIAAVADGDSWLDPRLPRLLRPHTDPYPARRLSTREHEVLLLLADGMTGQSVAEQLFLSPETVRTHVRNAMRKLGAHTRSQAIAMLLRDPQRAASAAAQAPFGVAAAGPADERWLAS